MKVLKKGDVEKGSWRGRFTCTGKGEEVENVMSNVLPCGAELELSVKDIFTTPFYDRVGNENYSFTFKCPCCGAKTDIDDKDLPLFVKTYAVNRSEKMVDEDNKNNVDESEME